MTAVRPRFCAAPLSTDAPAADARTGANSAVITNRPARPRAMVPMLTSKRFRECGTTGTRHCDPYGQRGRPAFPGRTAGGARQVLRPTSYVLRPTSYVLCPMSYVPRPTSYVPRPTCEGAWCSTRSTCSSCSSVHPRGDHSSSAPFSPLVMPTLSRHLVGGCGCAGRPAACGTRCPAHGRRDACCSGNAPVPAGRIGCPTRAWCPVAAARGG